MTKILRTALTSALMISTLSILFANFANAEGTRQASKIRWPSSIGHERADSSAPLIYIKLY